MTIVSGRREIKGENEYYVIKKIRGSPSVMTSIHQPVLLIITRSVCPFCARGGGKCLPGKTIFFEHFSRGKPGNVSAEVCPINPSGHREYNVGLPVERLLASKRLMAFVKHNNRTRKRIARKRENLFSELNVGKTLE